MKQKNVEVKRVGIGFAEALTLLFVGLKLGKVISWSWLWVLSPIWIPLALIIIIAVIVVAAGNCAESCICPANFGGTSGGRGRGHFSTVKSPEDRRPLFCGKTQN